MKTRQILCSEKGLGPLARKSKTTKNIEENKDSEQVEGVNSEEVDAQATETEAESNLTEEVSSQDDTSVEEIETDTDEGVEAKSDDAEEPQDNAEEDEAAATTEDGEDTTEVADPEGENDADLIETSVAGVVPALSEDTDAASPPPPVLPQPQPAPSAFPLVFGGLLAGAIGFLVATFAAPEGWPHPAPEAPSLDPEIASRLDTLTGDLSALSERVDNLPEGSTEIIREIANSETVDLGPLNDRIAALEGGAGGISDALSGLEQSLSELSSQVAEIADRPNVVSPDGSAEMEAQLETFRRDLDAVTEAARAEIEEAQARASQIEAEAAAAAEAAARDAAMAEVRASLEDGSPFAASLSDLGEVPSALSEVATDGVVPLAELQSQFPDLARATLQETHAIEGDASATDRFASFLRRHTNARSLTPREGEDVDAILSRAENSLSGGDIASALMELEALPEDAAAVMQDWMELARARADAVDAMNALN